MVKDIELIRHPEWLFERKIILYGASGYGKKVCTLLHDVGIKIEAFCDSDISKWGQSFLGYAILSIDELKQLDDLDNIIIIVSSSYRDDIIRILEYYSIGLQYTFTSFGLKYAIHFGIQDIRIRIEYKKKYDFLFKMWKNDAIGNHVYENGIGKAFDLAKILDSDTVVLLTPMKVGTKTMCSAFESMNIPYLSVHTLSFYFDNRKMSEGEYEFYKSCLQNKKVKIISMVREPIGRDISMFFQALERPYYWLLKNWLTNDFYTSCNKILKLMTNKDNRYYTPSEPYLWIDSILGHIQNGWIFDWFDLEIKRMFDIDIYEYPFDKEKGYILIKKNNIELLVVRLENLNQSEKVIGDFFEKPDFVLEKKNAGEDKDYKYAYRELNENIKLPREYVDFYYKNNKRMDYFYSNQEKESFLEKWKDNIE